MVNDFRLKVFISVATNLSFTHSALELNISQPAISKHIQELEGMYGVQFFERFGGGVRLTVAGELFLKYANSITESYRMVELELNLLTRRFSGELKVGASSTIAQYVIAPILAQFIVRYPSVKTSLIGGNTRQIERALIEHRVHIGLVEGQSRRSALRYSSFRRDELVLVTSSRTICKDEISIDELSTIPLVLRESGSGTLDVIDKELHKHSVKIGELNVLLHLDSTQAIKQFLQSSTAYAIVSIAAVADELALSKLKIVDITGVVFERQFAFISLGEPSGAASEFERFAIDYNQKL